MTVRSWIARTAAGGIAVLGAVLAWAADAPPLQAVLAGALTYGSLCSTVGTIKTLASR